MSRSILIVLFCLSSSVSAAGPSAADGSNCTAPSEQLKSLIERYQSALASVKEEQRKMVEDWNIQVAEVTRQSKQQEILLERSKELGDIQEAILKQTDENQVEFSKILSTWKTQQEKYQAYLDSLSRKP